MKIFIRFFLTFFLTISISLCFAYLFQNRPKSGTPEEIVYKSWKKISKEEINKIKSKAASLKKYSVSHNYNRNLFFLVDMSISSGRNRFFVYDVKADTVILEGLVAHGSCDNGFQPNPTFSNIKESGCTSLGKYRIGIRYKGRFGLAYKLHGLDSSNSNAFARSIVLHSYDCVPESETAPELICNSRGCPMLSPTFLKQIKPLIDNSTLPMLLWIFD